ncbi:hypothetical protein D3C81_1623660 [compost metagenome]
MQQRAVRQVHPRVGKIMAAGIIRAAHRQDRFVHQEMMRELRRRRIIKIDGQVNTGTLHIDVVIPGQHGQ